MSVYKYLYYKLFCIWQIKKDEPENAHINAVITITFLAYTNIFSIPLVLMSITKKEVVQLPEINIFIKSGIVLILILMGILNYFFLARKKEHLKIIKRFETESKQKQKISMTVTVLYVALSIGIPLYILFFTSLQ